MNNLTAWIRNELQTSRDAVDAALSDEAFVGSVERAGDAIAASYTGGGKLLAVGNGGSAADAMHLCEELTGRFRFNRPALPAIPCTDPGHLTCVANDFGYDRVFERFVEAHGNTGDTLVALSTSGSSENVLRAVDEAARRGLTTVGLTGPAGGKLAERAGIVLRTPRPEGAGDFFADRVQEVHMLAMHILVGYVERKLFGPSGSTRHSDA
ncbi:MAG: SIS domain-containing protein [Planctomycetota bacterium]